MNEAFGWFFTYVFPFLFIGLWLAVTAMLGMFAGWFGLQREFPDVDERRLKRLRGRSGRLGKGSLFNPWGGVSYGGCLRLDVCPSGLRIAVWKLFGAFQKPIFVPWKQFLVEEKRLLFFRRYRLHLGHTGSILTLGQWTFKQIANSKPPSVHLAAYP